MARWQIKFGGVAYYFSTLLRVRAIMHLDLCQDGKSSRRLLLGIEPSEFAMWQIDEYWNAQ